jgi:hypothetical protein
MFFEPQFGLKFRLTFPAQEKRNWSERRERQSNCLTLYFCHVDPIAGLAYWKRRPVQL